MSQSSSDSILYDATHAIQNDDGDWEATQLQESQDLDGDDALARNAWAKLVHVESGRVLYIPSSHHTFQVGRAHCKGFFNDNTISINHCKISCINEESDRAVLQDNSSNGTIIRKTYVHRRAAYLLDGDVVFFGRTCQYSFHMLKNRRSKPPQDGISADYLIQEEKILGAGGCGTVFKGHEIRSHRPVAIKRIDKASVQSLKLVDRESVIMEKLDHPNIVQFKGQYEDDQYVYFVLELVDGGDLHGWINKQPSKRLPEDITRAIIYQACLGLSYAHYNNVAHRDIKAENILLTKDNPIGVKIADFGLAKFTFTHSGLKSDVGTLQYKPPEILLTGQGTFDRYDTKVDSYSLGVTVYVMLRGSYPFKVTPDALTPNAIRNRRLDVRPIAELGISLTAIDFVGKLMHHDPEQRMSVDDALRHAWLSGFDMNRASSFGSAVSVGTGTTASALSESLNAFHIDRHTEPYPETSSGYVDRQLNPPERPLQAVQSSFSNASGSDLLFGNSYGPGGGSSPRSPYSAKFAAAEETIARATKRKMASSSPKAPRGSGSENAPDGLGDVRPPSERRRSARLRAADAARSKQESFDRRRHRPRPRTERGGPSS
ncbi:hypothetical protein BOTBODRAFT_36675 [Botryobasidium botryosum FD-172 SS1]|uniref:Uncharacterized protein n=1 Tax=Botryobasidium botryosum (strain FD-172 SS1) TaxID=930990 RepID=A0A067M5A3_BOTB1|nr:hypothetical protein BOTBODRAFT_36675 [Botryobasidium botryosum FD-172 SS1]